MWLARFLLSRVSEDFNITSTLQPKLFKEFNGSGCHFNYSTEDMRVGKGGMDYIDTMVSKLASKHLIHIELYGDNSQRLTGECETSNKDTFSCGVGDRGASIRIPTSTAA